jgi:hypothetical protein
VRLAFASATPFVLVLSIHAQTMRAHIAMEERSGVPIVQVSVNGTGPYPFVLDTGANVTVINQRLLRSLNIPWAGSVTIAASLGDSSQQRTESATLGIAGQSVEHVEINTLQEGQLGALEGHVQGILGENFLKYFDLLIDNDHHALTIAPQTSQTQSKASTCPSLARAPTTPWPPPTELSFPYDSPFSRGLCPCFWIAEPIRRCSFPRNKRPHK